MSEYRKKQDKKRLYKGIAIAAVLLAAGAVFANAILGMADHHAVSQDISTDKEDTVTYKDQTYVQKGNLETYLIAGIDDPGKVQEVTEYDGTGQCDVFFQSTGIPSHLSEASLMTEPIWLQQISSCHLPILWDLTRRCVPKTRWMRCLPC